MGFHFSLTIAAACLATLAFAHPTVHEARHLTRAADIEASYDYIVIGGGTSGLTVADRLTEDGKSTVLVVEYGYFEPPIDPDYWVPGGWGSGQIPRRYFYNITSIGTKIYNLGPGAVVGGSSAVNAMIFMRGTSDDYDRWGALGTPGSEWGWKNLLPYFKKAATFNPPRQDLIDEFGITYDVESAWGENGGPIQASFPSFLYPGTKIMRDQWKGLPGVEVLKEGSAGKAGLYWNPTSIDPRTVTRSFARPGHYEPVKTRPNYSLLSGYKVDKIKFSSNPDLIAESVMISNRDGNKQYVEVKAKKEIILAAGAIHTPQILQLSGVGPRPLLEAANITVVHELPGVGQNFQDHTTLPLSYQYKTNVFPNPGSIQENETFAAWALDEWKTKRQGPYSIIGPSSMAMLSLPVLSPDAYESIASDLEKLDPAASLLPGTDKTVIAGYAAQLKVMAAGVRSNNTSWLQFPNNGGSGGLVFNMHPLSRGYVNINISSPDSEPVVDYRALTNPIDLRIDVELFKAVRNYFGREGEIQKLSPVELSPGISVQSDEELATWVETALGPSAFHPVGTAAKSPLEHGGVVGEDLLVHGIKRLSIVDASIFPLLVAATTQSTVYAVAEKAADLIKSRK